MSVVERDDRRALASAPVEPLIRLALSIRLGASLCGVAVASGVAVTSSEKGFEKGGEEVEGEGVGEEERGEVVDVWRVAVAMKAAKAPPDDRRRLRIGGGGGRCGIRGEEAGEGEGDGEGDASLEETP